jgi:hypothetical protein
MSASAPTSPKDRKAARPHEEPENDQQHAENGRARKEHHDPSDDKHYGDGPQDDTYVTTHGTLLPAPSSSHTRARIDLAVAAVIGHDRARHHAGQPRAAIYALD